MSNLEGSKYYKVLSIFDKQGTRELLEEETKKEFGDILIQYCTLEGNPDFEISYKN